MKAELDQQLVTIQSLLFSEDIQQNGHRVINCEIFECAMRDGFSNISRQKDMEKLATEGFQSSDPLKTNWENSLNSLPMIWSFPLSQSNCSKKNQKIQITAGAG